VQITEKDEEDEKSSPETLENKISSFYDNMSRLKQESLTTTPNPKSNGPQKKTQKPSKIPPVAPPKRPNGPTPQPPFKPEAIHRNSRPGSAKNSDHGPGRSPPETLLAIKKLDIGSPPKSKDNPSPIDSFDQRRGGQDLGVDLAEEYEAKLELGSLGDPEDDYREKFLMQMKLQQDQLVLQQKKYEFEVQQTYKIECGDIFDVERNQRLLGEFEIEEQRILEARAICQHELEFLAQQKTQSEAESCDLVPSQEKDTAAFGYNMPEVIEELGETGTSRLPYSPDRSPDAMGRANGYQS
jgi:hypothetical protein